MKGNKCVEKRRGEEAADGPLHRTAANARERARMRVLSHAYSRLKTSLPWVPPDTKLSKLDTLRLAATYIAHLRKVLTDDESPQPVSSFTWPFTISNGRGCSSSPSPPEQPATPTFPPPCEYMAIAYPEHPRTSLGHYLH